MIYIIYLKIQDCILKTIRDKTIHFQPVKTYVENLKSNKLMKMNMVLSRIYHNGRWYMTDGGVNE